MNFPWAKTIYGCRLLPSAMDARQSNENPRVLAGTRGFRFALRSLRGEATPI